MHLRLLSWLFLCAACAFVSVRAQTPTAPASLTSPGLVLVAKVVGTVNMTANGTTTQLKVEDPVPQNAKIVTQLNSSVVLVFSNGATTQLGPDTEFIMEEFLQDPFASTIKVADLVEEPTPSRTKLTLNKGEIVGNVKKLKHGNGSSFTVTTPVGAAGIRGTTFRIVFRPTGTGQAFGAQGGQNFQFQLSTLEGDVGFQQGASGGAAGGNQGQGNQGAQGTTTVSGVSVPTGQEIVVTVSVTQGPQGQLVTVSTPSVTSTMAISATAAASFAQVAQEIITSVANATFVPPPTVNSGSPGSGPGTGSGTTGSVGASGGPTGSPGGVGNSQVNSFTNNPNTPTTSPPATTPPPRLTPGG